MTFVSWISGKGNSISLLRKWPRSSSITREAGIWRTLKPSLRTSPLERRNFTMRTGDEITLDEVERIGNLRITWNTQLTIHIGIFGREDPAVPGEVCYSAPVPRP